MFRSRFARISAVRRFFSTAGTQRESSLPPVIRLLLIGAPGSGKGTLGERMLRDYGLTSISSGDILRRLIQSPPQQQSHCSIASKAKQQMKSGGFVSDDILMQIMTRELAKVDDRHCLLDGFPRTLHQAEHLDAYMHGQQLSCHRGPFESDSLSPANGGELIVLHLDVPENVIRSRLMHRWVHPASGRIYNLTYNPPHVPFRDDVTGERLVQREDDQEDVIVRRLKLYQKETLQLLKYYKDQGKLVSFSGETSDVIYKQVQAFLKHQLHWQSQKEELSQRELKKAKAVA